MTNDQMISKDQKLVLQGHFFKDVSFFPRATIYFFLLSYRTELLKKNAQERDLENFNFTYKFIGITDLGEDAAIERALQQM